MQEEELLLKQRDRDFLKVLHEVRKGHITQRQGAEQLNVTDRWIRELLGRIGEDGDRAVIHRGRDRPSPRRIAEKVQKRAVEIVAREYADFGPTLAAEYLARDHAIAVSRETLRQWMLQAGLWKKRKQRLAEIHVWRRRRSCFGELVQWDTSDHDWLEGRGERIYLIAMIDDASSRAVARFARQDSTAENMRLLWMWVERYGRFVEAYTDRAGLFETNRPNQRDEERQGKLAETQIGRALRELRIGWIAARSPQAKGRIERFFKTAQDRLVKGMRKAKVCTLEQANRYLEKTYLALWNERFTIPPALDVDAHRPLGKDQDLESILSQVERRVIGQDYTLRYGSRLYQVERDQIQPRLRGQAVRIEQHLDGRFVLRTAEGELKIKPCVSGDTMIAAPPKVAEIKPPVAPHTGGRRRWMYGFRLNPSSESDSSPEADEEGCDSQ
jgi:hypothetical protein